VDTRGIKKIEHTIYRDEYEEMIQRLKSEHGKRSYGLRMQTVWPIFGTLHQHYSYVGLMHATDRMRIKYY
jgi:hypothetical protein